MGYIKPATKAKAKYYLKNKELISAQRKINYIEHRNEMLELRKTAYDNGGKELRRLKYLPTKIETEKYRLFRMMFD